MIGTTCSATIVMRLVAASTSRVPETPPSTEFSMGAMIAPISPSTRAVVAAATLGNGRSSGASSPVRVRGVCARAWSSA